MMGLFSLLCVRCPFHWVGGWNSVMDLSSKVGEVDFPFTAVHWVGEVKVVGEVSLPFTGSLPFHWVGG